MQPLDSPILLTNSLTHKSVIEQSATCLPFLKWAGGKRWLSSYLREAVGIVEGQYIEPFLGSGASYFSLRPHRAVLSDSNKELIATYRGIQLYAQAVSKHLSEHHSKHRKEYYYQLRDCTPVGFAAKAARFIYLNRTCWNGLYRVNLNGIFNVPIGTKTAVTLATDDFKATSALLKSAILCNCDFEHSVNRAQRGDVLFCDPPYTVRHNNNGFVKYNEHLFVWQDQVRLRDALLRAQSRGARIFVTNADHESIRELYKTHFDITCMTRFSSIGGAKAQRGKYAELLIIG